MAKFLWLDDVRRPPSDEWTWCKTVDEALAFVQANECEEWSLDHDLGGQDAHYGRAPYDYEAKTGFDFCNSLAGVQLPPKITIHSTNRFGAQQMADRLRSGVSGYTEIIIDPSIGRTLDQNPYYEDDKI